MCNVQSKHLHVEAGSDLDFEDIPNFRKLFILEVSKQYKTKHVRLTPLILLPQLSIVHLNSTISSVPVLFQPPRNSQVPEKLSYFTVWSVTPSSA